MTFYIQYDEKGKISATVQCFGKPPIHPRQLVFPGYVKTNRKRVNIETRELEDIPPRVEPVERSILEKLIDGIF